MTNMSLDSSRERWFMSSDLVGEPDGLSDFWFNISGKLALMTEDFGGVKASDNKSEPLSFTIGLGNSQLRSTLIGQHLRTLTLPNSRSPSSSSTAMAGMAKSASKNTLA